MPVCMCVCSGGIEEVIASLLKTGELIKAKAIFLTPLPCTPLRKKGATPVLSKEPFDVARQYTLDKREETVRKMLYHGCEVYTAYAEVTYAAFGEQNSAQVDIFNECCTQFDKLTKVPLNAVVEEELVGALYLLTDRVGTSISSPRREFRHWMLNLPFGKNGWAGLIPMQTRVPKKCLDLSESIQELKLAFS